MFILHTCFRFVSIDDVIPLHNYVLQFDLFLCNLYFVLVKYSTVKSIALSLDMIRPFSAVVECNYTIVIKYIAFIDKER